MKLINYILANRHCNQLEISCDMHKNLINNLYHDMCSHLSDIALADAFTLLSYMQKNYDFLFGLFGSMCKNAGQT